MNLIFFLIIIIIIVFLYNRACKVNLLSKSDNKDKSGKSSHVNDSEYLKYMHMGTRSKCFDCEEQFDYPNKYKGHSSKCFSCEYDLDKRYGPEYGFFAQPNKCFDCENQMNF